MKCPVCHGKKFVWKDSNGKIVQIEWAVDAQMAICDYCDGAGETSCCDGQLDCPEAEKSS